MATDGKWSGLAIANEHNILLTVRLREELLEGRSAREGAALAIEHAGPTWHRRA